MLEEAATYVLDYNTIRKQIFAAVIFFLPFVHTHLLLYISTLKIIFSALADLYNNYMCLVFFLLFESSIFDQGKNYSIFEKIEIEI